MRIGIISDTHDHLDATRTAFGLFQGLGVETVLHLGDIVSPFVVDVIREVYSGKLVAVFGNNDGDRLLLSERFREHGADIHRSPKTLQLDGHRLIMMHEPHFVDTLARSGEFDVVACGHLHEPRLERLGDGLIVNPGAASGYLSDRRTLALLTLDPLEAKIKEF
jgi:hypothetical protein